MVAALNMPNQETLTEVDVVLQTKKLGNQPQPWDPLEQVETSSQAANVYRTPPKWEMSLFQQAINPAEELIIP